MIACARIARTAVFFLSSLALVAACDEGTGGVAPSASDTTPATAASGSGPAPAAERSQVVYQPVGAEAEALGAVTVLGPASGAGSDRTFRFASGGTLEVELLGGVDITKSIGSQSAGTALGVTSEALQNGGDPKVYLLKVVSETPAAGKAKLCGDKSAPFAVVRQPESATDKTLTLVMLTGMVEEATSEPCHRAIFIGN